MPRPTQRIQIFGIQDRRSTPQATRPWVVRWSIEGRHRSRSFRRKVEAQRFRSQLDRAVGDPPPWRTTNPAASSTKR